MCDTDIMYGQYVVPHYETMVKFNVGQPSPDILPLNIVKDGMKYIDTLMDPSLLQYGNIPGYNKFRECFAEFLSKKYDENVNYEELFMTNGITNGITLICSLFLKTGSTIYVEEPTYFLAINIFKELGMNIVSIPIEKDGINIDVLEKELEKNGDLENHMLYSIPTFHNPTSYTMSHEKRLKLSEISKRYKKFIILADEVYQLLYFDDKDKPFLPMCYYSDNAISLGSFSKILAPGLRMGWIQTKNQNFMKKLINCGQYDSSGGSSPFVQSLIHGILLSGDLDNNIIKCREFLKNNCRYMSNEINEKMSKYVDFIVPTGGYFLWLKIKENINVSRVLSLSEKFKVSVSPGTRFSAFQECKNYIRLSFSYYSMEGIKLGVQRLFDLFEFVERIENKILVAINGYRGKLGGRICEAIKKTDDIILIEGIDRNYLCEFIDLYSVVIDVSSAIGTKELIFKLKQKGKKIPLIIGTTGDLPMEDINEYSKKSPVAVISNFSVGIPELVNIIQNMNMSEWDISMIEKHHIHKKDAPSGTAKTLQKIINKNIQIEAIREGEIIGEHAILFKRNDEEILIEHKAKTRDLFANGSLNYVRWILNKNDGIYYDMNKSNGCYNGIKKKFDVYSSCGNDFTIFRFDNFNQCLDKKNFVIEVSKKTKTDGVIFVNLNFVRNDMSDIYWEYYNKDGNTVKMCGNGSRSVVQYAIDNNYVFRKDKTDKLVNNFDVETKIIFDDDSFSVLINDNFVCERDTKYIDGENLLYYYDEMDKINSDIYLVDMLVPHLTFQIEEGELFSPNKIAKYIMENEYTGKKFLKNNKLDVNINLYSEINNKYYVRTYERGVDDETFACGTGCCSVAICIALRKKVFNNYNFSKIEYDFVVKSGHILNVKLVKNGDKSCAIYLSGHSEKMFDGTL